MVALFDQACQVIFDGMVGDAGHGDAHPFGHRAGGEHNIQFARGGFGILVEGFVKVTQAKEKNRIGVLAFDFKILLADGGDVV